MLNEGGMGGQGLRKQRHCLRFIDPVGLDECAGKSVERYLLWVGCHNNYLESLIVSLSF